MGYDSILLCSVSWCNDNKIQQAKETASMKLNNFEAHTDPKILSRGKGYYLAGHIVSLEYTGSEWTAEVERSDECTVAVQLSNALETVDTYCDCPYDWSE